MTDPAPGIDLWTAPITADGATATPEQMRKAWRMWLTVEGRVHRDLEDALEFAGVAGPVRPWPTLGIASHMTNAARKAGVIRLVKGRWEIAENKDAG